MSNLTGTQMRPGERGAITIKVALILVVLFIAGFTVVKVAPAYIQQTEIVHKVNELARIAASGSQRLRGTTEQSARGSQLRFCSLFSAILMPPLEPQDLSRSAVCELLPLTGMTAPAMPLRKMHALAPPCGAG